MDEATEQMASLDSVVAQRILAKLRWLAANFDRLVPEPLTGPWKGKYKLRVGDWRAVYTADKSERLISVHRVGHRSEIYTTR
ncbi:MAG: type II toxin-antitoxin system RelE/ParE family toxin [Planctomycetes bacterium]|nr:type II toxin-antitoxin system RelE/ParE family toxin [Planctomycetota bacterium]